MTAYLTRSPLQLLTNTHAMGDSRRSTRRTSARLADKEDAPLTNGNGYAAEKVKSVQTNGEGARNGKVEASSAAQNSGGGRGKRKHDYDEEDDGFMFTRTRSKRTKATPAVRIPEPVHEDIREEAARPAVARKSRKKSIEAISTAAPAKETREPTRRRSARNSGDSVTIEPPPLEVKKKRPKQKSASKSDPVDEREVALAHGHVEPEDSVDVVTEVPGIRRQEYDRSKDVTKIALPFADTPIIRRNKEMRKGTGDGTRRSSLGMRGRRASSLIDSGKSNALPHDEVESSEFYKHIESGLPEPRRMRQLLTWCGTRALGEKPSFAAEDSHAKLAAREIQQQLLKDFSTKSEMSDWFNREDTIRPPQTPQPNPKNLANISKIEELELQIQKLQTERQTWDALLTPPTTLLPPIALPSPQTSPSDHAPLLQTTQTRLSTLLTTLEFQTDTLATNVHLLSQYRTAADSVADHALRLAATGLEARERWAEERAGGRVGTREVLRGLSRVLER